MQWRMPARLEKKPLVQAAVGRFDGSLTVFAPFETGPDGKPNPGYRDLFPERPPPGLVPSCAEAGVIGALTGVMGTLQAMEVIKLITGIGEPLIGRLLLYDGLGARFDKVKYKRASDMSGADDIKIAPLPADFSDWEGLLALINEAFAYMDGVIDPPSSAKTSDAARSG